MKDEPRHPPAEANDVLRYWLGDLERDDQPVDQERKTRWFKRSDAADEDIRQRFGALLAAAERGELSHWVDTPRGRLALVIVLDQFSRNLNRGSSGAFANDPEALRLCLEAVATGQDRSLRPMERVFLYMPLMHSEDLAMQDKGVELFRRLAEEAPAPLKATLRDNHGYAIRHQRVIARFGRFPHRNEVLGRTPTPEEEAFLAKGRPF